MDDCKTNENKIEVRFFGQLQKLAKEKGWTFPAVIKLEGPCSAAQLAERMGIATDQIEAVFIDGIAKPIDEGMVKPGCRVGFIPYGVPGPYRVLLGIRKM